MAWRFAAAKKRTVFVMGSVPSVWSITKTTKSILHIASARKVRLAGILPIKIRMSRIFCTFVK